MLLGAYYCALFGFVLVLTKSRTGSLWQLNTAFTAVWVGTVLVSLTRVLGLAEPGQYIHVQLIVGLLAFNMAYIIGIGSRKSAPETTLLRDTDVHIGRVYALEALSLLLLIPNIAISVTELIGSGFDLRVVRDSSYVVGRFDNPVYNLAFRTAPQAIMQLTSALAAIDLAAGHRRFVALSATNVLILGFTFGDRTHAFMFLCFFVGALFLSRKPSKGVTAAWPFILFLVLFSATVSLLRNYDVLDLSTSAARYFTGGLSFLQVIVDHPEQFGLDQHPMLGYITLAFLIEPFVLLLKFFGLTQADVPSYHFNVYAQSFYDIGTNEVIWFNNNTTALYVFFRDFGVLAGFLGFGILGGVAAFLARKVYESPAVPWRVAYVYWAYVLLNSIMFYAPLSTAWMIMMGCALWISGSSQSGV